MKRAFIIVPSFTPRISLTAIVLNKELNMTRSHLFILSFLALAAFKVNAQSDRDSFRQAMDACFTETGVTKTERGVRPSDEDRQKIDACLSGKGISRPERPHGGGSYAGGENNQDVVREAMKACATENNLSQPSPGNPPSDEDRQKMESCLAEKGLSMPQRPERGGNGFGGGRGSRVSAQ